ncbi:MAG: hypothetical protein WCP20_23305 [Desulfuromonadales bacterium]
MAQKAIKDFYSYAVFGDNFDSRWDEVFLEKRALTEDSVDELGDEQKQQLGDENDQFVLKQIKELLDDDSYGASHEILDELVSFRTDNLVGFVFKAKQNLKKMDRIFLKMSETYNIYVADFTSRLYQLYDQGEHDSGSLRYDKEDYYEFIDDLLDELLALEQDNLTAILLEKATQAPQGSVPDDLARFLAGKNVFNLYRNEQMIYERGASEGYYTEAKLAKWDKRDVLYRYTYFAFSFDSFEEEDMQLLAQFMPKGYHDCLFPEGSYEPNLGILNLSTGQIVGFGFGRKNRVFIVSSDGTMNCMDDMSGFCNLDHGNVIGQIYDALEKAGDLHWDMACLDPEGNEKGAEEQEALLEEMDKHFCKLKAAVPTIMEIGEMSPANF